MRQWGEEHLFSAGEKHSILVDNLSGKPISKLAVSSPQGGSWMPMIVIEKK
ncbi:HxlR family transcriptional regulator [Yersinia enterocolitica subsp. palearctica YE-P4]|uniref:Transcriptional regulator, HxlR family n=1 Tax=Yersinia enterocolitica subsp. palearctica serotype O:3 (strain DSM 13030 / CIP 106945 / Y11) TaxID=930944 RepID=A0A0H3NXI3_YERE1|nr:putative transcriptional regulator [Yersinia enterocolitica subsp. palearctica PhRBD_Ye1]EOR67463.1 HxlR family transcriptional regulator [Yersinia enterocolitica subsp. palearctica YE-149]EOR75639.1 HxlR family transcriptional regulator [Yersinia enterocolitica subsp. palearctica YE-150]EOR76316.1 HxlR family transcriptional regulator [Yersinia enterocolitica subsp. palearctica YE-P1]EOR81089.1 HxlR family transcriptional regulator [Yersinia enterocolitica subsp. palearctica YE-P4]CBY25614